MIKLFQYPPASRSEIGKGVLVRMIPALLVLILSTIPLFIFIGKDSAANRDAVRKVTSQETEMAAAAVFIVFLLCVVYISIAAIKASAKHMRHFTCYAYYKGTLYSIGAAVPHSHSNTSNHGIGAAIALRLAKDGYNIALNDISEAMFEDNDIMDKIKAEGVECEKFICDVSSYAQVEETVKAVKARFGTIDVLVNNAGITRDGLMARMSEEQYDMVVAVNQKSVFNMSKFVGSVMMRQKSGKIINLASVAGLYGNPGQINYSATKAAIVGMTKTVAKELGSRGITCNAVAPGFIKTPMTDKLTDAQKQAMINQIAMKRYGEVDEIAGVVSFLASKDASYVTGQVIEISGGLMM